MKRQRTKTDNGVQLDVEVDTSQSLLRRLEMLDRAVFEEDRRSETGIDRQRILDLTQEHHVSQTQVANYWWALATADARELFPRTCCRYCWGKGNMYQYTKAEMRQRRLKAAEKRIPLDEEGGEGFDVRRPPNPDCPECRGLGVWNLDALDLSKVSPAAAMLFDGLVFKKGREGETWVAEVRLRNRSYAARMFQRLMGYEVERKTVYAKMVDPSQLDDTELIRELERLKALTKEDTKEDTNENT